MTMAPFALIAAALASLIGAHAAPRPEPSQPTDEIISPGVMPVPSEVIYSTFNSNQADLYDPSGYYDVVALHSWYQFRASWGVPFMPERTSRIHRIEIALGYFSGDNEGEVSVRNDAGGVPGDIITSWRVQALPVAGACCEVVTVSPAGLLVNGGQTYWLVAKTKPRTDTAAGWAVNSIAAQGPFARQLGMGWERIEPNVLPACRISGWISRPGQ